MADLLSFIIHLSFGLATLEFRLADMASLRCFCTRGEVIGCPEQAGCVLYTCAFVGIVLCESLRWHKKVGILFFGLATLEFRWQIWPHAVVSALGVS